jgi:tRNA pseudouridine32 synthase / 23S rRNA pseudouridine746 synthase
MVIADLSVLYADAALLVLDKPAGLLSVPGRGADKQDCLSARAQRLYADALITHRLDQATSGLMLMARNAEANRKLSAAFAERSVGKRYVAVVEGILAAPNEDWSVIDLPISLDWPNRPRRIIDTRSGKPSVTRWRVLAHDEQAQTTRIELEPLSGRSHQLRVHLQALSHPIIGDTLYGGQSASAAARMLLHAQTLELRHPVSGEALRFFSAAPF